MKLQNDVSSEGQEIHYIYNGDLNMGFGVPSFPHILKLKDFTPCGSIAFEMKGPGAVNRTIFLKTCRAGMAATAMLLFIMCDFGKKSNASRSEAYTS